MTSKECEDILHTYLLAKGPILITQEEFDDVKKAIKHLLLENQMQHGVIKNLKKGCKKIVVPIPAFNSSYMSKRFEKLENKVATLEKISGYDIDTLLEGLLSGQIEISIVPRKETSLSEIDKIYCEEVSK